MNKYLSQILILNTSLVLSTSILAAPLYDYVTSVKVNEIELNQAVPANQISKIINTHSGKFSKAFSECTGNYEFALNDKSKPQLKFEVFAEDNPSIKSQQFYKNKNNFEQLGATKGVVWLEWPNTSILTEKVMLNKTQIKANYTISQFKKDFPLSAKQKDSYVFILEQKEVKNYLKKPDDFDLGYTAAVHFIFKNGVLNGLEINQAIAC